MDTRYKYLVKNATILTIGQFSSKILSFLLVPLYTSVLSTREYGSYDLVNTTVSLLIPILTVNIADAMMRFSLDRDKKLDEVKSIALKYEFLGCFLAIIFIIFIKWIKFFPEYDGYYGYVVLLFISTTFNQFEIQLAKGAEKVKEIAIAGFAGTITTVSLNIILLLYIQLGLSGFYLAMIGGQLVPALYLIIETDTFKNVSFKINIELQRDMLAYSAPLIMTTVGWWVNSASDRYVVTWMCGLEVNGMYSISYKIPTIITTVQSIFIQAWQISAIKEYKKGNYQKFYGDSFFHLNGIMVSTCSVLLLFTKVLARLLYAKEFYGAWAYVPFLLVSSVFNASSGFFGPILSAKRDSKTMAVSAIYGTVTNVILNICLVYFIGAQGAAVATAISSFIIYYFRAIKVKEEIEYRKLKTVFGSWAIVILQSMLIVCGINMYVQIPLTALIIFIYKDEILKILQIVKSKVA